MGAEQITVIHESFGNVAPISEEAAARFNGRLFEIAPELKPLFRRFMTEQGGKLMATLAAVANGFNNLESMLPSASAFAKRCVDYGVKAADYGTVGAVLLWALERGADR